MKKNTFLTVCLSLFLVCGLFSQTAKTVWVSATGAGLANGEDQGNAYNSLTTALADITTAGDILRVVGTMPGGSQNLAKAFAYTIEGDAGGSTLTGVTGASRMFTINGASIGQNVTFKNITFSGQNSSIAAGGAVLYSNQAGVTINFENCRFNGNSISSTTQGGAALFITNSTVNITDCLFKENTALFNGGAISIANTATATLTRCTFYKNKTTSTTASVGGSALYVLGAAAVVNAYNCTFFQNTVGHTNQSYSTIRTNSGTTKVYNSLFYDNKLNNDASAAGDWGSPTGINSTLTKSIAQWINPNVTNTNSTVDPLYTLTSSNLTYDDTSGKVKFGVAAAGDATPIAFGSDGKDVGAWDSGNGVLPTITSLTSDGTNDITEGCGGSTLVIKGTNFIGTTAVTINGVAVASFVVTDSETITATLPAVSIVSGGVVVTTRGGSSTTGGNFAVISATPIFDQVAAICSGNSLSDLPLTSNNGITGTWSPALSYTITTEYTFTPTAGQCAATATMTITVSDCPAATFTWTGSFSNDWATAANWTKTAGTSSDDYPGQTPGRNIDKVIISNGGTPVIASGTYEIYSLAINNTTGGNTGSILTINSGATLTVNNTSATLGAVAITLKGGSIVNNGTLNATATNAGASFGIACLVPSVALTSATEYGYSGSGALNITTTLGNAASGGIQFNGTSDFTTYKMLFNGTTTFNLNNTGLAVYALRVVDGAKGPVIIGGTGFTLGTEGAPVNYGLLTMGNNGNNVTVDAVTTLTLNSAATNTAQGINIAQSGTAAADVIFTNNGTVAILGASSNNGINLSVNNGTQAAGTNKINFVNQGTLNVQLAIGSSSNNAALRVPGAGTSEGLVTITNTGILNLENTQSFTGVTGCPIRIFATANTPSVAILNTGTGTLTLTGQNINFGGNFAKSSIDNSGIIISSSEFQDLKIINRTSGNITFNYSKPATTRSVQFTVASTVAASAGATYTDANGNEYTVVLNKVNGTGTSLIGSFLLTGTTPPNGTLTRTGGTGDPIAYTAINLTEADPSSASNSLFVNNGTLNTGEATNLNVFEKITTTTVDYNSNIVISPGGDTVGNIYIKDNSPVILNGTLKLQIVSGTSYDKITSAAATGGFDITNAKLDVTGIFTPKVNETVDILIYNSSGTLTGNFASGNVTGLTTGWSLNYITGVPGTPRTVTFTVASTVAATAGDTYTDVAGNEYTVTTAKIVNEGTELVTSVATTATVNASTTLTKTGTTSIDCIVFTDTAAVAGIVGKVQLVYENTWIGSTDTEWATATNWSSGEVPISTSNVTIGTGSFQPIITSAVTVNSLTVNADASLTINSGGSLIVNGTSTGNVTYNTTLGTENWYLVSSPVAGETYDGAYVTANSLAINGTNNAIATYTTVTNTWSYMQTDGGATFTPGTGYSVRRATAAGPGDISFTGTINTSDVTTPSLATGFNLLGNPYTSYVNSGTFLGAASTNIDKTQMWVWNQALPDYEVQLAAASSPFILAPAQGFFVKATSAGTETFAKSNQATSGAAFQKSNSTEVNLWMTDGSAKRYAKLYYLDTATNGFDSGYEGEVFGGVASTLSVFTDLVADSQGKKYQIQSLPNTDYETTVVAVGVKAEAGKEITFTAEALNLPDGIKVFLEDRLTNTITGLDEANATYKVTVSEAIDGIGRFYLHTKASGVLSTNEVVLDNISIYTPNNTTLKVTGLPQGKATVKLFNILGKQVMQTSFTSTGVRDIALSKLATGMYIVQLETEAGKLNKKIVLE